MYLSMDYAEFAKKLIRLSEEHENDARTIFDTDWSLIVREAAKVIMQLNDEINVLRDDVSAMKDENLYLHRTIEANKERAQQEEKDLNEAPIDFFEFMKQRVDDRRKETEE